MVYRTYTTEFDRVIKATDIPRYPIKGYTPLVTNFSPNSLLDYATLFDKMVGRIERNSLPRFDKLVTEDWHRLEETVVSIVVDHSGSLLNNSRGQHAVITRLITETLCHLLFLFGIKHEVIGYTTRSWQGGRSRLKWKQHGSPKNPGRLCDLLHIIYRDFDTPLNVPPSNIEHLFRPDVIKENIDGEALEFAFNRLAKTTSPKKKLIYISDGAPIDDSTGIENKFDYLPAHCAQVLHDIQSTDDILVYGFGVNYSLESWVNRTWHIEKTTDATNSAFQCFNNYIFPRTSE